MTKPRIYCASPYPRAKMWRPLIDGTILGPDVHIVSTWHNSGLDERFVTAQQFADHWQQDFKEIRQADCVLAYAEAMDRPKGTLVECGYALAMEMPIHLVGNYPWGSWKFHPLVTQHETLRAAIVTILRRQEAPQRENHHDAS